MTSLGASAPVDYLIESVWFPNRKIKEGYHSLNVETKDGEEYTGTLARDTGEQLVLRDAAARRALDHGQGGAVVDIRGVREQVAADRDAVVLRRTVRALESVSTSQAAALANV